MMRGIAVSVLGPIIGYAFGAWLAILLGGCGPAAPAYPSRTFDDRLVIAASEIGWARAGLPDPGDCLVRLHVAWASDDGGVTQTCGPLAMQCLVGSTVVLGPGQAPRDAIHEAMHALIRCTGLASDVYDYEHTDGRVWHDYPSDNPGGADSAQGRARRAYDGSL